MADFLSGHSDTSGGAPLTQAQTVAICRHLQKEIKEVEVEAIETKRELSHTTEHIKSLQFKEAATHDDIHALQVGVSDLNLDMHKVQAEIGRFYAAIHQLQISDQNSKDKIIQLEENKKMVDTRLDVVSKDITQVDTSGKMLRQIIEKKVNDDMRILLKDLANTKLQLDHLREEIASTTEAEKEDRESVRVAFVSIENVLNEVKKSNTVTNIIEHRLASTAKGVQANWEKCAELGNSLEKLKECYELTKARIAACEEAGRGVSNVCIQTQHDLDDAVRQIERDSDRVTQAVRVLEQESAKTDEVRHHINTVRQSSAANTSRIAVLSKQVQEVSEVADEVRSGLRESSSLLLPNIHMDSPDAVTSSERHGTLLMSRGRPAANKGTPRRQMTLA